MSNKIQSYSLTKTAAYIGYVVQAVVINFSPMLFVTFMSEYGLSIEQVSFLVTAAFAVQFSVDFLSVFLIRRISYRALACVAHVLTATGLMLMAWLPDVMPAFLGLITATVLYSAGGGIIEVIAGPVIESCPAKNKSAQMSLLHSFYCWGQVITVLFSTLFFVIFGLSEWRTLALLWALIPLTDLVLFLICPMNVAEQTEKSASLPKLFRNADFLIIMLIIMCSGASELAVSQWASAYCETGLGVSKTVGDIAGPMAFALCMGGSRLVYSLCASRLKLERVMLLSGFLCVVGYLVITRSVSPIIGLFGFAICGFAVGVLWPGAFSLAAKHVDGGASMFALLSFSGDAGCTLGPTLAGLFAAMKSDDIQFGIACASVFPAVMCAALVCLMLRLMSKRKSNER